MDDWRMQPSLMHLKGDFAVETSFVPAQEVKPSDPSTKSGLRVEWFKIFQALFERGHQQFWETLLVEALTKLDCLKLFWDDVFLLTCLCQQYWFRKIQLRLMFPYVSHRKHPNPLWVDVSTCFPAKKQISLQNCHESVLGWCFNPE